MVRLVAARKKVQLLTEAAEDGRACAVDVAKLQQALINLLSNAVEHSTAGQRVWLAVHGEETELVFSVRDEGSGIAPEDQKKLFGAFVRAGTRKTAGERSVGLGLAIARLVVEAHGGRIWVESIPGEGATFLFAVPIQTQPQTREPTHP
jgi:signal transduction histidine kinase